MQTHISTPHMDKHIKREALEALQAHVLDKMSDEIVSADIAFKELTLNVRRGDVLTVLKFLRDDAKCQFKTLVDVCGVDWLGAQSRATERFDVVYHLLSVSKNQRLRVKVSVPEGEGVASVTSLYSSANWYEREAYDMFGILFENHPDLRRILSDYDFDGHPLRKDFPLEGKVEAYYDAKEERVAYKPVDLPQEFRHFDQQSAWSGMTGNAKLAEQDAPSVYDEAEFNK